MKGVCGTTF